MRQSYAGSPLTSFLKRGWGHAKDHAGEMPVSQGTGAILPGECRLLWQSTPCPLETSHLWSRAVSGLETELN